MKKSAKSENMRRIVKIFLLSTLVSSGLNAFADETPKRGQNGARYITVGHKALPAGSSGNGMTYGIGAKSGHFGVEIYSACMQTIPEGMERIPAQIWGGGTPTGQVTISDPSAGFDFNFFIPLSRRIEVYAGPSLNFERVAKVYTSDGSGALFGGATKGQQYADFNAPLKTRFNGQAGIGINLPTGAKYNLFMMAGYSLYRGITCSIGVSF